MLFPNAARRIRGFFLAVMAAMVFLLGMVPAQAGTPSTFVGLTQPISIASLPTRLVATRFCADRVLAINQAGTITTFANLPSTGNMCLARDVVVSPGLGGFQKNFVYAVQKQTIYRIPPAGGAATAFVTLPAINNSETSLTFDTVGTFGFNLIATDRLGKIYRITSSGVATLVVDLGHHIEGPQVAPTGFAPFGGQLLATNDFTNSVFAVNASGVETPVVTYTQPESVEFVPSTVCEFQNSGGALFVESQTGNLVYEFPASDFTAIDDGLHALVMTKAGKIGVMSTNGSAVSVADFQTGLQPELEDSIFARCS
jgi:hypothetical protein